jgi:hypothetical protein
LRGPRPKGDGREDSHNRGEDKRQNKEENLAWWNGTEDECEKTASAAYKSR